MDASFLKRYEGNPIITPESMPFPCYTVFNAGATIFNGTILLLLRVEHPDMKCLFHTATSEDGFHFEVNPVPVNYPLRDYEIIYGSHRYDPRITCIDGVYYISHAIHNRFGAVIGIAKTTDFVNLEPVSNTSVPFNRNGLLFPEKINGLYARFERPLDTNGNGGMWITYSPDLEFWGKAMPIDVPRNPWSEKKVGAGAVPIRTDKGWLTIYHGTYITASTENYSLGVMLLDLEDPSKIIAAPKKFILAAEKDYECMGQVPNVVFTSGAVVKDDGTINVYYGGADTRVCVAQTTVDELLTFCITEK